MCGIITNLSKPPTPKYKLQSTRAGNSLLSRGANDFKNGFKKKKKPFPLRSKNIIEHR